MTLTNTLTIELESDDVDTIAGYCLTEVGRIPSLKNASAVKSIVKRNT